MIENRGWVGGCLYLTPPTKNPDELILISSLPFKSVSEFLVQKEFDRGKFFSPESLTIALMLAENEDSMSHKPLDEENFIVLGLMRRQFTLCIFSF